LSDLITSFYENGNKQSEGLVLSGLNNGEWKYWYPNGQLHQLVEYNNGMPANGWSYTCWNERGDKQETKYYSHQQVIEHIWFDDKGVISSHWVWNNRWKEMVDKFTLSQVAAVSHFEGTNSVEFFITHLQAIYKYMNVSDEGNDFKESYQNWLEADVENNGYADPYEEENENDVWVLTAPAMELAIWFIKGKDTLDWTLRVNNEVNATAAKLFMLSLP
jgi:hypothetical protein